MDHKMCTKVQTMINLILEDQEAEEKIVNLIFV